MLSKIEFPAIKRYKEYINTSTLDYLLENMNRYQTLSPEQKYAFTKYKKGENIFITGQGGAGKSYLIQTIVQDLIDSGKQYAVTALTGCAAVLLNCGARTIHSFSGVGLCQGEQEQIINRTLANRKARKNWTTCYILIIDEVSMMSKKLFGILEELSRAFRHSHRSFGGLQVIFIGDFYQLPPVGKEEEPDTKRFCFEHEKWNNVFPASNHILLKTVFRQKCPRFLNILDEVRAGELSQESIIELSKCVGRDHPEGIKPIELFPVNAKAEKINREQYQKINSDEYVYPIRQSNTIRTYVGTNTPIEASLVYDSLSLTKEEITRLFDTYKDAHNIPNEIALKVGTNVMCLHNFDVERGICNGSQGIIARFTEGEEPIPIVRFTNGQEMAIGFQTKQLSSEYPIYTIDYMPLRLGYAFTIHKSQGITLDMACLDIGSSIFEYGQTYVALSRLRDLSGLYLSQFNPRKIKSNPKVIEFYKNIPSTPERYYQMTMETELCAICLDDIDSGGQTKTTQCNHRFHESCLESIKTNQCPCCRAELSKPDPTIKRIKLF